MIKRYVLFVVLLICFAFYGCKSKEQGNAMIEGKWYFSELPGAYIEFNGNTCTEHNGDGTGVTYSIKWVDDTHYDLTVTQADGLAALVFKPGDVMNVEVKELTKDYYRYYVTGKGSPQCIFVVRKKEYEGPVGTPC